MSDINYPSRALNSATDSVTIAGTIVANNPSVSTTGTAVPASATYIGLKDSSGNLIGAPSNANGLVVSSATTSKTGTLASPSTGSVIASFDASNFTHFSLQLSVGTATVQVQQSNDNTTWTPVVVITSGSPTTLPVINLTSTGLFSGDIEGNYVRVQVTANSAGSVVATLFLSDGPRHDVGSRYVGVTAGSAIIGKVGIDQTTPGTTNGVQVNAALPAGANVIGGVTQSGTWNINNVSGTVSLPTGAATSAKQPALGTAGTASTDVITVQGIAGATAVKVDGSAVTQPVSGTVTANAGTGSFTVAQATASNLNAVVQGLGSAGTPSGGIISVQGVVSGTAVNMQGTVAAYGQGTAGSPATGVLTVQGITNGTPISVTTTSKSRINLVRNNYAVTPVTTSAYVQILGSTTAQINRLYIFDSSGSAMILATGAAGSESDQLYIGPGGNDAPYELLIGAGVRLSLKALDVNASVGQFILTALG
jgi:hypothetical protein